MVLSKNFLTEIETATKLLNRLWGEIVLSTYIFLFGCGGGCGGGVVTGGYYVKFSSPENIELIGYSLFSSHAWLVEVAVV